MTNPHIEAAAAAFERSVTTYGDFECPMEAMQAAITAYHASFIGPLAERIEHIIRNAGILDDRLDYAALTGEIIAAVRGDTQPDDDALVEAMLDAFGGHCCYDIAEAGKKMRAALAVVRQADAGRVGDWQDGEPPKWYQHLSEEWFIAETTYGDRVVLRALPEEYAYDYTTADSTYIKADKIRRWMQFPDSQYVSLPLKDAEARAEAAEARVKELTEELRIQDEANDILTKHKEAAEARERRLRDVIERAPHAYGCEANWISTNKMRACNCFKAEALKEQTHG